MSNKVCAFFGHRTIPAGLSASLERTIRYAVTDCGVDSFWCGGYGMFDDAAAGAVHRLKAEFPGIELLRIWAYLPTEKDVLSPIYDGSIYPEGLELVPKRFAITHRNRWMAKECDIAICYVTQKFGGAYTALHDAQRYRKAIINLAE